MAFGTIARCLRLKMPSMHTITWCKAPGRDLTQNIMLDCPDYQSLHLADVCRHARVRAARRFYCVTHRSLMAGLSATIYPTARLSVASCPAVAISFSQL